MFFNRFLYPAGNFLIFHDLFLQRVLYAYNPVETAEKVYKT
jgi:hypothetical protein